jgi:glycosyltransferase involved in cell wall biosynthesis
VRVILLVTDHELGGTPLRLARLARGLRAAGVDVHAGCLAGRGPVTEWLESDGVATFSCDARGAMDVLALRRLAHHVRRLRPDLIHSTLMHANVAGRLVGWMCGVPVVSSTATIEVERRWHRVMERLTARMDAGHIVNSGVLGEHVIRAFHVPRERLHVVPPSLVEWPRELDRAAARAELRMPADEFVVAWVGRFDPVKRLDLLVRCAEMVRDQSVRFLLAGDGPARSSVERMLEGSSAQAKVRLLGWRDDVVPLLRAADLFVFPSRTEGMPNAVLEAMACGLPIVASDLPVLRELAGDGERLRLVASDDPQDYASAVDELQVNEAARRELGAGAAAWARRHLDSQGTTNAVLGVYEHILRGTQQS